MNDFGLPQRTLDEIHAIFAKHSKVKKVVVYGSRAMGNYHKGSDIDLTMFGDDLGHRDEVKIAGELDDSSIPYLVDLSIFAQLDHIKLKDHIERKGKVFYDRYAGWKTVKLRDVCEIQPEKKEVKARLSDDSYVSFMGMALLGVEKKYAKTTLEKTLTSVYKGYTYFADNDVLLAKITPCFENGKLGIASTLKNGVGFGSSEFIVFRCLDRIIPEYLYYFLNQKSFREEGKRNMSGAVGQKRVIKDFIANSLIPLPPLAEQERIVAKLDSAFAEIDKAIAATKRKKEQAETLKQSILTKELSAETDAIRKTVKLGDVYKVGSSKRVLKSQWKKRGVPFFRGREITLLANYGSVNNDLFITEEHYEELVAKYGAPMPEDIMITAIGTIGNAYIVRKGDKFYFKDGSVLWLKKTSNVLSEYVNYWLTSNLFKEQLDAGNGATVDTLTISKLASIQIKIPSLAEQERIVAKLDATFAEIDKVFSATTKIISNYQALKSAMLAQELHNSNKSEEV